MKKTIIVMPVANEGDTMGEVLDRILGLPYDDLSIYPVVDDYSTDNTAEVIRSYEHTGRVKCIYFKRNRKDKNGLRTPKRRRASSSPTPRGTAKP